MVARFVKKSAENGGRFGESDLYVAFCQLVRFCRTERLQRCPSTMSVCASAAVKLFPRCTESKSSPSTRELGKFSEQAICSGLKEESQNMRVLLVDGIKRKLGKGEFCHADRLAHSIHIRVTFNSVTRY